MRAELFNPLSPVYFFKDGTVRELKVELRSARGERWGRLAGLVLREARPEDALHFLELEEIRRRWREVAEYLGGLRDFWEWLLVAWADSPSRNSYGSFDSLPVRYWKAQGLSTRTTNALLRVGLRTCPEVAARSARQLAKIPNLGEAGLAQIATMLVRRGMALAEEVSDFDSSGSR